ncbi:NB-ARC domain-containing protein [Embleya sp. NPDC001921]
MAQTRVVVAGALVVVAGLTAAVAGLAGEAAAGDARWPWPVDWVRVHAWWVLAASVVVGVVLAVATMLVQRPGTDAGDPPPPAPLPVEDWWVDREQASAVIAAVRAGGRGTVGITTSLHGAGGFGKTTLARVVCADRRVRRRFRGRVYTVTIGRDVRGRAAIAAKVADATRLIIGDTTPFDDPQLAGAHLGRLLDRRPRTLLVLDDVWTREQLAPFLLGGRRCVRLVTTRVPDILTGHGATPVPVDEMSVEQAGHVLTRDLPGVSTLSDLPADTAEGLLRVTGRWPLLLRIVNRLIAAETTVGQDTATAAADVLARLRAGGPTAGDDPHTSALLDMGDPDQRSQAARTSLEAAIRLLRPGGPQRFAELGVFAEDEAVPVPLITALWQATAGHTPTQSRALIRELNSLSLLSTLDRAAGGTITLHDVVRDHLRLDVLGPAHLATLHGVLVDVAAASLPPATPLAASTPAPASAWWDLPDGYLAEHLIAHMIGAGRAADAEALAGDIRWIETRLDRHGPTAPWLDLTRIPRPRATRLARDLARATHLLAPTDPPHALPAVLHSRLQDLPDWRDQVTARQHQLTGPRLVNAWAIPDHPSPALERVLTGHTYAVNAVAISPDGTWLVSAGDDGTVRIWDRTTGTCTATLTEHTGPVNAVAIAQDGTWLATAGRDRVVRIWDRATGTCTAILVGHVGPVNAVAISRDGTWLATTGGRAVGLWSRATARYTAILNGHTDAVQAVAISPDGTWLASAGDDGTVRIWDRTTGNCTATLTGHTNWVLAVAISRDGTWLATTSLDRTVRIWDRATGTCTTTLTEHTGWMIGVAIAQDGTWLATTGFHHMVRIWDRATGTSTGALTGHTDAVQAVAISPDGTWLATAGDDRTVRIWEPTAATLSAAPISARAVAISRDGTWLASASDDGTVRIWDRATGTCTTTLTGHTGPVHGVAISRDGTWLVSAGDDRTVRIWNRATGTSTTLIGPSPWMRTVAISRDGTWLATADDDATVRIRDRATGTVISNLHGHTGRVSAAAMSQDGWLAVAGDDHTVRIWKWITRACTATLTGHTGQVSAVAISSDGTWLATADDQGEVRIWNRATGTCIFTFTGHTGQVRALTISPDGTWLATAGDDREVRIWDPRTGQAVALARANASLFACAWTPDGRHLAVGGGLGLYLYAFHH